MAGLFTQKNDRDPTQFWQDYEKRHGERVLAFSLGRYLSGWAEYDGPLWGLLIATDGGFRFHHFPHEGWIQALSRVTGGGPPPEEKTMFIPTSRLLSVKFLVEKTWWKRILFPSSPVLELRYQASVESDAHPDRSSGPDARLLFEAERKTETLVQELNRCQTRFPN